MLNPFKMRKSTSTVSGNSDDWNGKILKIDLEYLCQILDGNKTVEGRLDKEERKNWAAGDVIRFEADNLCVYCRIEYVKRYGTFREMLEKEDFKKCLPKSPNIEAAVETYLGISNYRSMESVNHVVAYGLSFTETRRKTKLQEIRDDIDEKIKNGE